MRNVLPADPIADDRCCPSFSEAPIRTLSVSLVAVAAIAASLLLTRSRDENDAPSVIPFAGNQPGKLQLDAIRAAGL
jgi:hypothetical protein